MNYVKRKGSNAGKVSVSCFNELQEVFLADIKAEVLMNDIPKDLIFNYRIKQLYSYRIGGNFRGMKISLKAEK